MLTFKNLAMKKFSIIFTSIALLATTLSCAPEDDIQNPAIEPFYFYQDFTSNTTDGANIDILGWTNFAEAGTVKWEQGIFSGTKYAEFSGYQSGQASNIGWLISPAINMDLQSNEKLAFDVAQAYVGSSSNSIELFVSKNFDGVNVLDATWQSIPFNKPPLNFETNFDFFSSGIIDLSEYTGYIYLAFKVKSSGTNFSLDGTYTIDNIRIFNQK
jgi:hypothetical protein